MSVPVTAAIQRALDASWRPGTPVALEPLRGGHSSARLYRVSAEGRDYVLRMVGERTAYNDPGRQLACLAIAARLELAPALRHASVEDGIAIVDWIETRPAALGPGRHDELAGMLRRLHHGPDFPVFMSILDIIPQAAALLAGMARLDPALAGYLARIDGVRAALRPGLVSRPCHNDLNPNNILCDGRRLWLIDWEAACMGDPWFDLATVATFYRLDGDAERRFLTAYLERPPGAADHAKLQAFRHIALCFYALMFMLGAAGAPLVEPEPEATLAEALAQIGAGSFDLAEAGRRLRLARLLMRESLARMG